MGRRDNQISNSILSAIFHDQDHDGKRTIIGRLLAFFSFFRLILARYKDNVFKRLRGEEWEIDEDEYRESFRSNGKDENLKAVGDLGYSGSVCCRALCSMLYSTDMVIARRSSPRLTPNTLSNHFLDRQNTDSLPSTSSCPIANI